MATQTAKNASGTPFDFELPLAPGRAAAASSRPVALSTEDKTALDALATSAKQDTLLTEVQSVHKAEDAAHATGDKGVMALVVRKDTAAAIAGTDGDYAPLEVDASGRLWVNIGTMIALPAGTNNIGDVDIASALPAGTNLIGKVGIDQTTPGTTNGVVIKDSSGNAIDQTATINVAPDTAVIKNGNTSLTPKFAAISSTGSGDTVAVVSGKKIRVVSMFFVLTGASTVKFQTGAATDLTGAMSFAANGGISLPYNPNGWFETASGAKLNHVLGSSVGFQGGLSYLEV